MTVSDHGPDRRPPLAGAAGAYREWPAPLPLRGHIRCLWMNRVAAEAAPAILVVPDGCIDILWMGDGLRVAGPDTRAVREIVPAGGCIVGVRFRPAAASSWLRTPAGDLLNARAPLGAFWGMEAERLAARLAQAGDAAAAAHTLASALLARLPAIAPPDPAMRAVFASAARSRGVLSVRRLARELRMGERTLRRRSHEAFGYGPKTLQRVLRFQRFLRLLRRSQRPRLVDLAVAAGFADQAHLAREVRRLAGLTPGAFLDAYRH